MYFDITRDMSMHTYNCRLISFVSLKFICWLLFSAVLNKLLLIFHLDWRRTVCVRSYRALQKAVNVVLQRAVTWRARRRYVQKKNASIVLQSYVRMWMARKKYNNTRAAIILLQSNVRRMVAQRRFLRMHQSAAVLQRFVRSNILCRVSSPSSSLTSSCISSGYQTASASIATAAEEEENSGTRTTPGEEEENSGTRTTPGMVRQRIKHFNRDPSNSSLDNFEDGLSPERNMDLRRFEPECEESGIETDSESLSGDFSFRGSVRQTKQQRQDSDCAVPVNSSQLRNIVASLNEVDGVDDSMQIEENSNETQMTSKRKVASEEMSDQFSNVTVRRRVRKVQSPAFDSNNIASSVRQSVPSSEQVMALLETIKSKDEVQLLHQDRNIFLKKGIISFRKINDVSILLLYIYRQHYRHSVVVICLSPLLLHIHIWQITYTVSHFYTLCNVFLLPMSILCLNPCIICFCTFPSY